MVARYCKTVTHFCSRRHAFLHSPGLLSVCGVFQVLSSLVVVPHRQATGPLLLSVDHCFSIRGQGTVMTGTLLSGAVAVGDVSSVVEAVLCRYS